MNMGEKRRKLHEFIDNSNENIVDTLFSIIESQKISANNFLKDYNREIDEAMESIDKGFFITHENVEKNHGRHKKEDCVE
jgi:predicted transcriptional regulator